MSAVIEDRCKRLNHLDQNGTVEGVGFPNAQRVVTIPPGVEQAAKGSFVCTCGMWEVLHRWICPWRPTRSTDARMLASGQDVGGGIVAK